MSVREHLDGAWEELRRAVEFHPVGSQQYREQGWWTEDTLDALLVARAREMPEEVAISTPDETFAYAHLEKKVQRLSSSLYELGISKGDVVAVQLLNSPEYLITHVALSRLGAVTTPIHMSYRAAEVETILTHCRASAVICMDQLKDYSAAELMLEVRRRLGCPKHIVVVGRAPTGAHSFSDLLESGSEHKMEAVNASDRFMLAYTSGTTRSPKAVCHTYHTLLSNARVTAKEFELTTSDRILGAGPYSHLYQLLGFHMSLYVGASNVVVPAFSPQAFHQTFARTRPTLLFAVPAHIKSCLEEGVFDGLDLSSLRIAFVAGSAVPAGLVRNFAGRIPNGSVVQLWGMTEMQAGLYTRPGDSLEIAARSCGRPAPGTEVRLLSDAGEPMGPGQEGELQVRGCSVFPGYFRNEEANREAFTEDGWFRTGDLAVSDDMGNITITGRIKDIINRGGVKYAPRDVEDLLCRHPKIQQVAIVPVPDPVVGEKACCIVVPAPGASLTLEEICTFLGKHRIAKHKLPERLEIVEAMPMGPTRKILKEVLKQRVSR